jgi:hypothetical protein
VENTKTIVNAYFKRGDHNVWIVDWSNYSVGNYANNAVPNMVKVCDHYSKKFHSGFDFEPFLICAWFEALLRNFKKLLLEI